MRGEVRRMQLSCCAIATSNERCCQVARSSLFSSAKNAEGASAACYVTHTLRSPYAHRLAILCLASLKHTMWLLQTSVCLSSLRTHKRNRARTSAIAHAQAQVEISACPYNRARVPHDRFQHLRFP